jgi:hypothetical protein
MELATIRSRIIGTISITALAACGGGGGAPPYQGLYPAATSRVSQHVKDNDVNTCATSPPQYYWIFEGACQAIEINSGGANYSLDEYRYRTVSGSIGKNSLSGTVQFDVVDAVGNGDIEHYNGMDFPHFSPYSSGNTVIYVAVINQSKQDAEFIDSGVPIFSVTVTDANGFPAKRCGLAILTTDRSGSPSWDALYNVDNYVNDNTVTISWYDTPRYSEWPSHVPVYFAVYCPYEY